MYNILCRLLLITKLREDVEAQMHSYKKHTSIMSHFHGNYLTCFDVIWNPHSLDYAEVLWHTVFLSPNETLYFKEMAIFRKFPLIRIYFGN